MNTLNLSDVTAYVEEYIGTFHQKRLQSVEELNLTKILKRKNPYLFRAKNFNRPDEIILAIVDAHISSSEETIFGDWLEGLVLFVNNKVYGGVKSGIPGIDLEFDHQSTRYIVSVKSGKNWGNSSQIKKMITDFTAAKRTLRTSNSQLHIVAVNGCCYGRDNTPDKGQYYKYCGQRFWEFISGNTTLYTDIIEPLGHQALERNQKFTIERDQLITRLVRDFSIAYTASNGSIDWKKITELNSQQ